MHIILIVDSKQAGLYIYMQILKGEHTGGALSWQTEAQRLASSPGTPIISTHMR